jgi:hypothetical protein
VERHVRSGEPPADPPGDQNDLDDLEDLDDRPAGENEMSANELRHVKERDGLCTLTGCGGVRGGSSASARASTDCGGSLGSSLSC